MLKKMLALLLILAMALGCTVAQAAAPGEATLFGPDEDGTPSDTHSRLLATVGDTLYMLMNETDAETGNSMFNLYSYTVNKSDAPELLAKNVPYTQWYNTVQEMQDSGLDPNQGVTMLVGDADTLYVFNQLTGAEFRFAQRPPLHQQLAQLVEGAKVASMLGGKNDFHGCRS